MSHAFEPIEQTLDAPSKKPSLVLLKEWIEGTGTLIRPTPSSRRSEALLERSVLTDVFGPFGGGKIEVILESFVREKVESVAWVSSCERVERFGRVGPWRILQDCTQWTQWLWLDFKRADRLSGSFATQGSPPPGKAGFSQKTTRVQGSDLSEEGRRIACELVGSQCFDFVIFEELLRGGLRESEVFLRRLQLNAKKAECGVIFVGERPFEGPTWPLASRLQVKRDESGELQIEKLKARSTAYFFEDPLA